VSKEGGGRKENKSRGQSITAVRAAVGNLNEFEEK